MPLLHPLPWVGKHGLPVSDLVFNRVHPLLVFGHVRQGSRTKAQRSNEVIATTTVIVPNSHLKHSFGRELFQSDVIGKLLLPDRVQTVLDNSCLFVTMRAPIRKEVAFDGAIGQSVGVHDWQLLSLFDEDVEESLCSRSMSASLCLTGREHETDS